MIDVLRLDNKQQWDRVVVSFEDYDVYYTSGYVEGFRIHGDGEPILLYYHTESLRAMCVFMLRDIAQLSYFSGKIEEGQYFDAITPYGYGGFLFEGDTSEEALAAFHTAYKQALGELHVVSCFVRYHPVLRNVSTMRQITDTIDLGKTIQMDLGSPEIIQQNITSKHRNMIRKAMKNGVTIEHGTGASLLELFVPMYNATMDKDNADAYYYFGDAFYTSICEDLHDQYKVFYALFEGKVIAMSIMLYANKRLSYHLSGSLVEYRHLAPSNLLLYEAALWGSKMGLQTFHLGGGVGSGEDGLYKFKEGFNRHSDCTFSIGKEIHNQEVYDMLVAIRARNEEFFNAHSSFFPVYRAMK